MRNILVGAIGAISLLLSGCEGAYGAGQIAAVVTMVLILGAVLFSVIQRMRSQGDDDEERPRPRRRKKRRREYDDD
jgi:hypothetical protein